MKLNRKIPLFGEEHNKLQASVMAVKNNENIVRLQVKSGIKDGVGFASVLASDFKFWKKDDPEGVKRMWKIIETVTPEYGESFLVDLGIDIQEMMTKEFFV